MKNIISFYSADHDALDEVLLHKRVHTQNRNGCNHNHAVLDRLGKLETIPKFV